VRIPLSASAHYAFYTWALKTPTECCRLDEALPVSAGSPHWGVYVEGAVIALRSRGHHVARGLVGAVRGEPGVHGGGISSSAALGCAVLLALEAANNLCVSPHDNIQLDR
jgi:galactokinase